MEKRIRFSSGDGGMDEEERVHIAWNPNLRLAVLKEMAKQDSSIFVRDAALASWAVRLSKTQNVTANELWKMYVLINKNMIKRFKRYKVAKEALIGNWKFPMEKVRKKRK